MKPCTTTLTTLTGDFDYPVKWCGTPHNMSAASPISYSLWYRAYDKHIPARGMLPNVVQQPSLPASSMRLAEFFGPACHLGM
eukprot:914822-Prorocentrum_minimum.AAC.1